MIILTGCQATHRIMQSFLSAQPAQPNQEQSMARISYVDPATITDPQIRRWLDDAVKAGRPGPENQAIRAHQPDVMRSFTQTREMVFDNGAGVVEHDLKELLRAYVAHTVECGY